MVDNDYIRELEQKHGVKIEILRSDSPENPRNLGSESSFVSALKRDDIIGAEQFSNDAELSGDCSNILEDFIQHLKAKNLTLNKVIYLPVYADMQNGVSISTMPYDGCLDSGQAGYIYLDSKKVREKLGVKQLTRAHRDIIHQRLTDEIALLNSYICNEVYTFTINGESPDKAGDFYGIDLNASGLFESLELALSNLAKPA